MQVVKYDYFMHVFSHLDQSVQWLQDATLLLKVSTRRPGLNSHGYDSGLTFSNLLCRAFFSDVNNVARKESQK